MTWDRGEETLLFLFIMIEMILELTQEELTILAIAMDALIVDLQETISKGEADDDTLSLSIVAESAWDKIRDKINSIIDDGYH